MNIAKYNKSTIVFCVTMTIVLHAVWSHDQGSISDAKEHKKICTWFILVLPTGISPIETRDKVG